MSLNNMYNLNSNVSNQLIHCTELYLIFCLAINVEIAAALYYLMWYMFVEPPTLRLVMQFMFDKPATFTLLSGTCLSIQQPFTL